MRTIFAEYNPQRNSIDVYTSAGYMLRIDCWEVEKNLTTTPWIWLCIKRTCYWRTTWICKIVSWWNDANVGRCRRFFNDIAVESHITINELWTLIIFCIKIPMYNEISFKKTHIAWNYHYGTNPKSVYNLTPYRDAVISFFLPHPFSPPLFPQEIILIPFRYLFFVFAVVLPYWISILFFFWEFK